MGLYGKLCMSLQPYRKKNLQNLQANSLTKDIFSGRAYMKNDRPYPVSIFLFPFFTVDASPTFIFEPCNYTSHLQFAPPAIAHLFPSFPSPSQSDGPKSSGAVQSMAQRRRNREGRQLIPSLKSSHAGRSTGMRTKLFELLKILTWQNPNVTSQTCSLIPGLNLSLIFCFLL